MRIQSTKRKDARSKHESHYESLKNAVYKGKKPQQFEISLKTADNDTNPSLSNDHQPSDILVIEESKAKPATKGLDDLCTPASLKLQETLATSGATQTSMRRSELHGEESTPTSYKKPSISPQKLVYEGAQEETSAREVNCCHNGIKKPLGFTRTSNPHPYDEEARENTRKSKGTRIVGEDAESEVMCVKCNRMVSVNDIERHSNQCYYNLHKQVDITDCYEDKISPIYKYNCLLGKLRNCMEKSAIMRKLPEEQLERLRKLCEEAEAIVEPTAKGICQSREMIVTMINLQRNYPPKTNETVFLYLERIIYSLKMKNYELTKLYNHLEKAGKHSTRMTLMTDRSTHIRFNAANADIDSVAEEPGTASKRSFVREEEKKEPKMSPGSIDTSVLSANSSGLPANDTVRKMTLKRMFFTLANEVIRGTQKSSSTVSLLDKEKLFVHAYQQNLPMSDWQKWLEEMAVLQPDEFMKAKGSRLTVMTPGVKSVSMYVPSPVSKKGQLADEFLLYTQERF